MVKRSFGSSMSALVLLALVSALSAGNCVDPLSIETPRKQWVVNLDSLVTTEPFIRGPGDSLHAVIAGESIPFANEVQRPFHNGVVGSAHYVTVQASRQSLDGRAYEVLSLRLDAIRDTGTYRINSAYSAPKTIDSFATPVYAAQFERRRVGGYPEAFRTGTSKAGGSIRVVRIDEETGVMVGNFALTAYCAEIDSTIDIALGVFRLQLRRH